MKSHAGGLTLDVGLVLSAIAILIASFSASFAWWQAWQSKRTADLQERALNEADRRFLLDERRSHYAQLNELVLSPLKVWPGEATIATVGLPSWHVLGYNYDVSQIRASPYFADAQKHLEKEYPTFVADTLELEDAADKLTGEVNNYFLETIPGLLKQRLSSSEDSTGLGRAVSFSLSETYRREMKDTVFVGGLVDSFRDFFVYTMYNRVSQGQTLDSVLSGLTEWSFATDPKDPTRLSLDAAHIANLSTPGLQSELKNRMESMKRDRTISETVLGFAERRASLQRERDRLKEQVGGIVYRIESNKYEVICECCPDGSSRSKS